MASVKVSISDQQGRNRGNKHTSSRRILKQSAVNRAGTQVHVTHVGASHKQGFHRLQLGVFRFVDGGDIVQFQVQKLVDGL